MARPKTYAVCEHCGASGLAWVRLRNARWNEDGAYHKPWAWLLCVALQNDAGEALEDSTGRARPWLVDGLACLHGCPGYRALRSWMVGDSATRPSGYTPRARKSRKRAVEAQAQQPQEETPEPEPEAEEHPENAPEPPMQSEQEPMQDSTPKTDKAEALIARALALVAEQASKAVDEESERVAMTCAGPREALNIARDLEQGETFEQAAESWVWRGLDPATRDRILAKYPYPEAKEAAASVSGAIGHQIIRARGSAVAALAAALESWDGPRHLDVSPCSILERVP